MCNIKLKREQKISEQEKKIVQKSARVKSGYTAKSLNVILTLIRSFNHNFYISCIDARPIELETNLKRLQWYITCPISIIKQERTTILNCDVCQNVVGSTSRRGPRSKSHSNLCYCTHNIIIIIIIIIIVILNILFMTANHFFQIYQFGLNSSLIVQGRGLQSTWPE